MKRKLQSKYTIAWIAWGLGFVALEGLALYSAEPGDTLSEQVWAWTEHMGSFGFASVGALLVWLLFHFSPWEKGRRKHGPGE